MLETLAEFLGTAISVAIFHTSYALRLSERQRRHHKKTYNDTYHLGWTVSFAELVRMRLGILPFVAYAASQAAAALVGGAIFAIEPISQEPGWWGSGVDNYPLDIAGSSASVSRRRFARIYRCSRKCTVAGTDAVFIRVRFTSRLVHGGRGDCSTDLQRRGQMNPDARQLAMLIYNMIRAHLPSTPIIMAVSLSFVMAVVYFILDYVMPTK
jgi:hypothetical protein